MEQEHPLELENSTHFLVRAELELLFGRPKISHFHGLWRLLQMKDNPQMHSHYAQNVRIWLESSHVTH